MLANCRIHHFKVNRNIYSLHILKKWAEKEVWLVLVCLIVTRLHHGGKGLNIATHDFRTIQDSFAYLKCS